MRTLGFWTLLSLSLAARGGGTTWKLLVTTNLVIDAAGRIRFYTLVDTLHFDDQLVGVRQALDAIL